MRSTIVKNELMAGSFLAVAILIAVFAFAQKSRELGLLDTREVHFTVPHGSGLQTGAPVLMKGIQVGEIADVQLTEDNQVKISCRIAPRFAAHIRQDARAAVVEPPVLGSTKVEIDPGTSGELAEDDHELAQATHESDLFQRVDEIEGKVNDALDKLDKVIDAADETISTVQRIAGRVDSGDGLAGQLINDPELAEDARSFLTDVREIARSLRSGDGALAMAINDAEFADDLEQTASDLRALADEVNTGKGSLGRLLKDPELVEEATGLVKDVRGSLARLNELNEQAKVSMVEVEALLENTNKTVQSIDQLVSSADSVTAELADTLERINTGEGTLSAFLNDDSIYRETKSLLKELRESVEDLREQAPINSFIGVVFSAF